MQVLRVMFSKATAKFVHQIDPEGSLIHVSRVNDSRKLLPMALVVKRNRSWFWQKSKYQPTDFTLGDLLLGDEVLRPEVSETEFLTYTGTFGDRLSGKLDTEAGPVSVVLEGRGSSKLQSSFGKLRKQELDVTKLLKDSEDRLVDMQHVLVQQLKRRDDVLAVVKERILTTSSCSVTLIKKDQCTLRGVLRLLGVLRQVDGSVKVCVKESTNFEADSDVSLEIPPGTVIAYSIRELKIRKNGQYDIGLQPGTTGGIESDSLETPAWEDLTTVDGGRQEEMLSFAMLLNESQETELGALAELPRLTRGALFQGLRDIVIDRSALACLQSVLEGLCRDSPDMTENEELSEGERKALSAILGHLGLVCPVEEGSSCSPQMNAVHLLVSALEELPDETLNLLGRSTPEFLEAVDKLISNLKEAGEPLTVENLPAFLQENRNFQLAEQLFTTTSVSLRRDANRMWVETESRAGLHTLLLYLSVRGLVLLACG